MEIVDRRFAEMSAAEFHDVAKLRVDVFVAEQECPYAELDGRDTEAATRHLWLSDDIGVRACLRMLDDSEARRIGRVATRRDARRGGHAAQLVEYAIATSEGPWVLDAQTHLIGWYQNRGFVVTGPEFVEDGIAHRPMRRG